MSIIIGITHSYENNFIKLSLNYLKALSQFGVTSLIIPYSENIDEILKITDGIILSGGGDLSEYLLSEEIDPKAEDICPQRDIFESELCKKAFEQDIPLLGICRGIQIMNVSLGGKINQHIEGHMAKYSQVPNKKNTITHNILIKKESPLYKMSKTETAEVNSIHHQCISELSPDLTICAKSRDSVIEAVCAEKKKFFMGVQWHPEKMSDDFSKNIFKEFINVCKK